MKKVLYKLDDIETVTENFLQDIVGKKVVTFIGGLGAGKTTFIKTLLKNMGVRESVTSPTFTYFNQYVLPTGMVIYHFDLYRLKDLQEFELAGFFEYLYQPNSIAFIEWPEIIDSVLKKDVCKVSLNVVDKDSRLLIYEC